MRLGFFSAILPDLSLAKVLEFAAMGGFSCIEVACWPTEKADRRFAGITHIDVDGFENAQADEVKQLCSQAKVGISALGYYPNALDPDLLRASRAVDHLKKAIVAAERLGVGQVNTFIGRDWTKTVDDNWPRFLETWKPIIAFAEDRGVRIGIENCPMLFSNDEWPGGKNLATSPVIWRRMFNDIPSKNFGLNFDPSHFVLQQMDPLSPLREFRDKLFHVHAKDVSVHRDRLNEVGIFALPKLWHTPRIPGFGEIDWPGFIARLYEVGYEGAVCIEVEDDGFGKSLAGRQKALNVARNILRPYFA